MRDSGLTGTTPPSSATRPAIRIRDRDPRTWPGTSTRWGFVGHPSADRSPAMEGPTDPINGRITEAPDMLTNHEGLTQKRPLVRGSDGEGQRDERQGPGGTPWLRIPP